jgi:DNA sulfur modification protein DndB
MENSIKLAAVRGVQAGRAYYVVMVPMGTLSRIFSFDGQEVPVDLRAQRDLNRGRIPAIARYLLDHPEDYVIPPLTASIDGEFRFTAAADGNRSVGTLEIGVEATLLINDGQHRRAGIAEAIRERPHLAAETVAVALFPDRGLTMSRQMFVDLNQHGVRPPKSLRLYYDDRDRGAALTRAVMAAVPLLRDMTDTTRSTLPTTSRKLFAFSSLAAATAVVVAEAGLAADPDRPEAIAEFWSAVIAGMPDWQRAGRGGIAPAELRRDYVHAHGVALEAIAVVGARAIRERPQDWTAVLARLGEVDWARSNTALWEGRVLAAGRINRSRTSVLLAADAIWRAIG